jgi:hypothetical protein
MNKSLFAGLIVIAIIAIGGYMFPGVRENVQDVVGANPGPEALNHEYFRAGITTGGGCFSTSTTGTLSAGMIRDMSCIYITATGAGQGTLSLTLPASSTMSAMIPRVGDCQAWFVDAADVAAATTTTFVAGTGHNVVGLDATGAGTGADVIDGAEYGKLTSCREKDGDVVTFVQEYIHAD